MQQALIFTADFKLGHYMKIPPRTMFWCQVCSQNVTLFADMLTVTRADYMYCRRWDYPASRAIVDVRSHTVSPIPRSRSRTPRLIRSDSGICSNTQKDG